MYFCGRNFEDSISMKIINFCVNLVQKYLPDPFVLAIFLTLIAALTAMPVCHQTPMEVIEHWGNGVWRGARYCGLS